MSKIQEYLFSEYYIPLKIRINLGMVAYWAMLPSFLRLPSFLVLRSSTYCRPFSLWKCGLFLLMYKRNGLNIHQKLLLHFLQHVSNKPSLNFFWYNFEIENNRDKIREILCDQCSDGSLPSNSMEYLWYHNHWRRSLITEAYIMFISHRPIAIDEQPNKSYRDRR